MFWFYTTYLKINEQIIINIQLKQWSFAIKVIIIPYYLIRNNNSKCDGLLDLI